MKTKRLSLRLAAALAALVSAPHLALALEIHGSSTVHNSLMKAAEPLIEAETGIDLKVVPNGSGSGLRDLALGRADLAMISSSLESVAEKLNKKQPGLIDMDAYESSFIKDVEAVFIVHPSNPISSLSDEQIAGLISGEITSWSEVGGLAKPILVITMIPGDGVRSTVESRFLDQYGKEFASDAREMPSSNQASNVVRQVPHAIGISSTASLTPGVKVLSSSEKITQSLYLVSKGAPNSEQLSVIEAARKH